MARNVRETYSAGVDGLDAGGESGCRNGSRLLVAVAARFISGLPHGAYFGVASIVAGKRGRMREKARKPYPL